MLKRLAVLILCVFLLCGCTKQNTEEITFSSWGSVTETAVLKQLINDFEVENPDIKINFIHIPQNYFQKLHLLFASNTAPDVIFINNLYLPVYKNHLEDLSTRIDRGKYYAQSLDGMSVDGRIYAVPRDISNLVFYVNLDKVNLPLPDIKDFVKLKPKGGGFTVGYEEDIYFALPYLWAFGGGVLDENGELIINSSKSKEGLEFYKDLYRKYKIAPSKSQVGSSTLAQMFLDKKIAIYLSGRWMFPKISEKADFNWAVTPFFTSVPCDVSGWAVSKNSKHKEAAFKFVDYLASEKSSEYFAKTGLIVPARMETSKLLNGEHNEGVFLDVIKTSKKTPVNKDYKKLTDEINFGYLSD